MSDLTSLGDRPDDERWNLFARELEDILADRGLRLGHLDNRKDAEGAPLVHREKVRRLQRSLRLPKSFTVLNPEELEQVIRAFALDAEEQVRLYAALLATAIQLMLMDRINVRAARAAALQVLPMLRQALAAPVEVGALREVRGGGTMRDDQLTDFEARFEKALDALDRANLALHLIKTSDAFAVRIERAREARDGFQRVLRLLDGADEDTRAQQDWRDWHEEARRGFERATRELASFGVPPDE